MLPVLTVGSWFSLLATTNESTLLGLGVPSYTAIANSVRFVLLLVGLPLGLKFEGLQGAIVTPRDGRSVSLRAGLYRATPPAILIRSSRRGGHARNVRDDCTMGVATLG